MFQRGGAGDGVKRATELLLDLAQGGVAEQGGRGHGVPRGAGGRRGELFSCVTKSWTALKAVAKFWTDWTMLSVS